MANTFLCFVIHALFLLGSFEVNYAVSGPPIQSSLLGSIRSQLDPYGVSLSSWKSDSVCSDWIGIVCDENLNVIEINLVYSSLNGSIPSEISSISTLVTLNLTGNWLVGPIPATLGSLSNLKFLDLSANTLEGELPSSLGSLTNLIALNVRGNFLSGAIPTSLSTLSNLEHLNLGSNNFSGSIPDLFAKMTNLTILSLFANSLSGPLPASIVTLKDLRILNLAGNFLTGDIPTSLDSLLNLQHLNLSQNLFSGRIPSFVASINSSLIVLDLSSNRLTGTIPKWSANNLTELHLNGNQLTGHLSLSLSTPPSNLRVIDLGNNAIGGPIPVEWGGLSELQIMKLSRNVLSGNLPPQLSSCTNLTILDLSYNLFVGPFPPNYTATFTNLQQLRIDSNSISGIMTYYNFSNLAALVKLSMSENQFSGSLPAALPPNALTINFEANNLDGDIDGSVFDGLKYLTTVLLGRNQLSGSIPYQLWNNTELQYVTLNNNSLTDIPTTPTSGTVQNGSSYILLGGNPICANLPATIDDELEKNLCSTPTTVTTNWSPDNSTRDFPVNCYKNGRPNCPGKTFPSIPYYVKTNGSCICAQPLNITVLLSDCPFLVYGESFNQLSLKLRLDLTTIFKGVTIDQIWVIGATQKDITGAQLIIIQLYASADDPVVFNRAVASQVINFFQNNPQSTGSTWGPVTFVSAALTLPPDAEPSDTESKSSGLSWWVILIIVVTALFAVVKSVVFVWICMFKGRDRYKSKFDKEIEQFFVRHIPMSEILAMTDGFSEDNILGEGGFGTVYKGEPKNGETLAIKRTKEACRAGALDQFQNEVRAISRMSHSNLVKLVGYCDDSKEQILVYEFCSNGNLQTLLHPYGGPCKLSFEKRLDIAIDVAEGLRYMHIFASPPMVHRDIKTENILLSATGQAKIADFGLLKDLPKSGSEFDEQKKEIAGTQGYIDPEYFLTFKVTPKSDVYSFGVVLLEIITGKSPMLINRDSEPWSKIALAAWAAPYIKVHQFENLVDPSLREEDYPKEQMDALVQIACDCVERLSLNRPDMNEVANRLGNIKMSGVTSKKSVSESSPSQSDRFSDFNLTSQPGDWPWSESATISGDGSGMTSASRRFNPIVL